MENKNVLKRYNLPEKVVFCKKCTISNQRPRISFDSAGLCSACRFAEHKKKINWKKREDELLQLCDKHRKNDGSYDVIVPFSGGKDSSMVAHQLKNKYGMNPLTVTWQPHIYTDIGLKNYHNCIRIGGLDNLAFAPNGKVNALLTKLAFLHLGDPFQPFIYGVYNYPLKVSLQYKVPLIMYGEHGEVEYGGDMEKAYRSTRTVEDQNKYYFSGLPPEFWIKHGISEKDMMPYKSPKDSDIIVNKTEIHFFSYYKFWDPQENYYYCVENTGFFPNPERSEGTYSKYASLDDKLDGFHYYLSYIKFGISRTTSDSAHEIRDEKITKEEGVALVKKYDGEFPSKNFNTFLEYIEISESQFWEVIDSWRSDHIWKKNNGEWQLKHPIWENNDL